MPNSPDCNPLDYYVWSAIEQETNKTSCNIKDELKARIRTAFTNLNKNTIGKFARDSEVVWGSWEKLLAVSLNEFNQKYFMIFS